MSQQTTPEPFGYFKSEPFGWTDCAETDEGATPLFDEKTVSALVNQRDELAEILQFSRRAFDYYDCNIEQWSVAKERRLRREAIKKIDAAMAKLKGGS